jgi:glucokinase
MSKLTWILVGIALVVVGGIWTFQGLGYIGGSSMSGQEEWAIIGPGVAGIGVALVVVATRPRS